MSESFKKIVFKKRFSCAQIFSLVFSTLVFLILEVILFQNIKVSQMKQSISEASTIGETVGTGVKLYLNQSLSNTQVLSDLCVEYGDDFINNFDKFAEHLLLNDSLLKGIFLAPDGIVKNAYPESLKDSIGFNIFEDDFMRKKAILAQETHNISFEGPVNLLSGGVGLVVRKPVYKNDKFYGFIFFVIDWPKFVDMITDFFNSNDYDYNFAVWIPEINNLILTEQGYLFSNINEKVSDFVSVKINIPNEDWFISVEPKNGWKITGLTFNFFIFSLLILSLLGSLWYKQFDSLKKTYELEHDPLTGLYTRSSFCIHAEKMIKEHPDLEFDLIMSDIEAFKVINSIHGNKKCDEFLIYFAQCIQNEIPEAICGRYGGDQFVCLYPAIEGKGKIYLESRTNAILEDGPIESVNVKYGYIGNIDKTVSINLLCDRALMAARSILHNFDVMIANYEGEISRRHYNEQMIESSFEEALKNGDFQVWYQPKFDAKTEKLIGAEALVRWIKKDGSIVSPSDFIYVFEEDGLIVNLDEYVFRTVCETIKTWLENGVKAVPISVNISRTSLHHRGIVAKYKSIIDRIGIPIEYVPLEITESLAFGNEQIKNLAKALKKEGFRIDMDDFGTGSSSLASLNILPFDVIKLDKSLIDYIGTPDGEELLRHSIELAHFKNIKVIAEGVESEKQLKVLRNLGCDAIQGYYYKPPMNYEDSMEYLNMLYTQNRI